MNSPKSTKVITNIVFTDRFTAIYRSITLSTSSVIAAVSGLIPVRRYVLVTWSVSVWRRSLFLPINIHECVISKKNLTSIQFNTAACCHCAGDIFANSCAMFMQHLQHWMWDEVWPLVVIICFFHKLFCRQGWWDTSVWPFQASDMKMFKC